MTNVSFLFWNLYGKQEKSSAARIVSLRASLSRLARQRGLDVILLAECAVDPNSLAGELTGLGLGTFHHVPSRSQRIVMLSRLSPTSWTDRFNDGIKNRLVIQELQIGNHLGFLVACVHLWDRMSVPTPEGRQSRAQEIAMDIRKVEEVAGHRRTILVGDFNMNPFEGGMIDSKGMHGIMSRQLARTMERMGARQDYPCFYNPMWGCFGDLHPGPPGTYFFSNSSDPTNHFWNVYDQVLVRPELMDKLSAVEVLESDGQDPLVTKQGRPRKGSHADHLPLFFQLTL